MSYDPEEDAKHWKESYRFLLGKLWEAELERRKMQSKLDKMGNELKAIKNPQVEVCSFCEGSGSSSKSILGKKDCQHCDGSGKPKKHLEAAGAFGIMRELRWMGVC